MPHLHDHFMAASLSKGEPSAHQTSKPDWLGSGARLLRSRSVLELCRASCGELIEIQIALDASLHLGARVLPAQFFGLFLAIV
jgi:hypothetical protein